MEILLGSYSGYPKDIFNYQIDKNLEKPYCFMLDNFNFPNIKTINSLSEAIKEAHSSGYCFYINKECSVKKLLFNYEIWIENLIVKKIDISKLWALEEYDGSIRIKYIEYDILDEKIGYCEFKKERI